MNEMSTYKWDKYKNIYITNEKEKLWVRRFVFFRYECYIFYTSVNLIIANIN